MSPIETLFVVDSMTGQDAAHTAKAFSDALPLTGVILTKTDGDARGVQHCLSSILLGNLLNFWVPVKKLMHSNLSILIDLFQEYWAWEMSYHLLKK